jgi:Na+/glutamate symporter
MSQRDGFTGGFLAGTIVGGIVGGIIGALVGSRLKKNHKEDNSSLLQSAKDEKLDTEANIEMARRRLENKIAQLNLAIDDVREQFGQVKQQTFESETLTKEG